MRGDIAAITLPQKGNSLKGRKIPLMKTRGNLTSEDSIIIFDGVPVGGEERRSPMMEKHREARIMPMARIKGLVKVAPVTSPMIIGMIEIAIPKDAEASISPSKMVETVTGQDISLSKVFAWVSQGATAGVMAVEMKKTVIASSPGIRRLSDTCRPKA